MHSVGRTRAAQLKVKGQACEGCQLLCWWQSDIDPDAMLPLHHLPQGPGTRLLSTLDRLLTCHTCLCQRGGMQHVLAQG